jgi:hypothetical protein
VQIAFVPPETRSASSVTIRLAYRSDALSLPGKGADTSVRDRITDLPSNALSAVNDLGYALRVVESGATDMTSGPLFKVAFDRCQDAAAVTLADVACVVEACGSQSGLVPGCRCTVTTP